MSSAITIKLSLALNDLVFDKDNFPSKFIFDIGDDEGENNVRIELGVAKVFHKILNSIREDGEIFQKHEFELLGEILSKIVFGRHSDPRRGMMEDTFMGLRADVNKRCRILLNFDARSNMADLPWEYILHKFKKIKGSYYLSASSSSQFQVVRYYPEFESPVQPPVDVLFVIVVLSLDPNNNITPRIGSLRSERENIIGTFQYLAKSNRIEYEIVEDCCVEDLETRIAEVVKKWNMNFGYEPPYILHYVGHSYFERKTQTGKIVMKRCDDMVSDWITDTDFASVFLPDRLKVKKPTAVFFQSCDSAKIGVIDGMLRGVAYECLRVGIPAVIGMQNEINPRQSCTFYQKVYSHLLDGEDISEAVTKGRDHLGNGLKDVFGIKFQPFGSSYKNNFFGSPVLFISGDSFKMVDVKEIIVEKQARVIPVTGDAAAEYGFPDRASR